MNPTIKKALLLIVLLTLGAAVSLGAKIFMDMKDDVVVAVLILAPSIVYAIMASGISGVEFGIGGFKTKLETAANKSIEHDFGKIGPGSQDLAEVGQRGVLALEEMLENYQLSESKPIVMILKAGIETYPREETAGFVEKLSRYKSFKFVVIVDHEDKVRAFMASWAARRVLGNPRTGDDLLEVINNKDRIHELSDFHRYIQTEPLRINDKNSRALQQMIQKGTDALVVVDEENKLVGVAERDLIVARMLLSIVAKHE